MNKQLQNELSDAQLDAISGGSYSRECGEGRKRDHDHDCDNSWKKSCNDEPRRKHQRDYDDDCSPSYRSHRCG